MNGLQKGAATLALGGALAAGTYSLMHTPRQIEKMPIGYTFTQKDFDKDLATYNAGGMKMSDKDLVNLTRLVYLEGAHDPKAKTLAQAQTGLEGIASVIENRWAYDKVHHGAFGKGTLQSVGFKNGKNKSGKRIWQFSAIPDNPSYFNKNLLDKHGNIKLKTGRMTQKRADLSYNALRNILLDLSPDPTSGALFYQNPRFVAKGSTPAKWKEKGLKEIGTINSHLFFTNGKPYVPHTPYLVQPQWYDPIMQLPSSTYAAVAGFGSQLPGLPEMSLPSMPDLSLPSWTTATSSVPGKQQPKKTYAQSYTATLPRYLRM
jgi:hypothetical protein